jgi:hypothetical protein
MTFSFTTPRRSDRRTRRAVMNAKMSTIMKSWLVVVGAGLVAVAALVVVPKTLVKAQSDSTAEFEPLVAYGFRANASSPLILRGPQIGNNAVWQVQFGPIKSNTFAMFHSTAAATESTGSSFSAGCHAEYSEVLIVANGGTLTLDLFTTACGEYDSSGAGGRFKKGVYTLASATGRFQQFAHGTGDLSIHSNADGSEVLQLLGVLKRPAMD